MIWRQRVGRWQTLPGNGRPNPRVRKVRRPRNSEGSWAALRRAKKKPLGRQSEVIPKFNYVEMFEIPACRAPQGRSVKATTNMSCHVFLSPFRKTSLPIRILLSSFMQEYPSANRRAAHQRFSLRLEAAKPGVSKGVGRDAASESSGQSQVAPLDSRLHCCRLPCPACLPGLAPITRERPSADSCQESVCRRRESSRSRHPLRHSPLQPNGRDFHRHGITDETRSSAGLVKVLTH